MNQKTTAGNGRYALLTEAGPACLILLGALLSALVRAVTQWQRDRPEWCFYQFFVKHPLAVTTGPDQPIFGYLPGCKALLTPFVQTEPFGYFAFATVNALSCIGVYIIVYRNFTRSNGHAAPRRIALLWLSVCSAVPFWFAIQNNQLVAPSVFLTLSACSLLAQRREWNAGFVLALAILLKTLPLPMLLLPLLCRRWRTTMIAGVALVILSVGLTWATDGIREGVQSHIRWPQQVLAQRPQCAVTDAAEPKSFHSNQSAASEFVRLAKSTGIKQLIWAHTAIATIFLVILVACSIRPDRGMAYWYKVAAWMSWIAYAAPFGRYYYLLFLVPGFYILGLNVLAGPCWRRRRLALLTVAATLLAVTRSRNPGYATVTFMMQLYLLPILNMESRRDDCTAGDVGGK